MKKIIRIISLLLVVCVLFSCSNKDKKPFGAEEIDYDKVEGINKEGPIIDTVHSENRPPMGDKTTYVEAGPPHIDYSDIKVEPTADLDDEPDYGGIPIVKKGNDNGS